MSSEAFLREDIVRYCRLLHQKGFLAANDGNVSARLSADRILITPTGVHKGFLSPEQLLIIDRAGRLVFGEGRPSGEVAMHLKALELRPDRTVVMHAHPPTCIALSLLRHARLNGVLPEVILSIGELVVVPYARPVSDALGQSLVGYVERHDALILERHGTLTLGRTVHEAYCLVERLEHSAKVLHLAHAIARPPPLPEPESRALLETYRRSRTE